MQQNITERALIQRINRKLKPDWKQLRTARIGGRLESNVGRHYLLDTYTNTIANVCADPERLGRELGVAWCPGTVREGYGRLLTEADSGAVEMHIVTGALTCALGEMFLESNALRGLISAESITYPPCQNSIVAQRAISERTDVEDSTR